jgi:chromosome segregation ATPase
MAVNLDFLFGHASFCQRWKGVDGQPVLDAIAEIKDLRAQVAARKEEMTANSDISVSQARLKEIVVLRKERDAARDSFEVRAIEILARDAEIAKLRERVTEFDKEKLKYVSMSCRHTNELNDEIAKLREEIASLDISVKNFSGGCSEAYVKIFTLESQLKDTRLKLEASEAKIAEALRMLTCNVNTPMGREVAAFLTPSAELNPVDEMNRDFQELPHGITGYSAFQALVKKGWRKVKPEVKT